MEDMHIHLQNGIENQEIFNKYVEKCISMNLKKVVFLEHGNRNSSKHVSILCTKSIINMFNDKINKFNQSEKANYIEIFRGIEIDYSTDIAFKKETEKILEHGKFDWVIGALHNTKFLTTTEYFESIIDMLNNYNINAVAHLKLGDSYMQYEYLLLSILKLCYSKNVFIEINTSDRSRWNDEQLYYMLNLINKCNAKYVFSSDAHKVEEVGYMIKETMEKVKKWKAKK